MTPDTEAARIAAALTEAQKRALLAVPAPPGYIAPSALGSAMGGTISNKAQGLGRLGGTMGSRLVAMGLCRDASWHRAGFPAYCLSAMGVTVRAHLAAEAQPAPPLVEGRDG